MEKSVHDLIEELKKGGVNVPKGMTRDRLNEAAEFLRGGATPSEVDAFLSPEKEKEEMVPMAKVREMIEQSNAQTLKDALGTGLRTLTDTFNKHERFNITLKDPRKELPTRASKGDVPPEFFDKEPMYIHATGIGQVISTFIVKGQYIELPRSKTINFKRYHGGNTQAFGDSSNLVYQCFYVTHDRREKELFMADDRFLTGEFWLPKNRSMSLAEMRASIVVRENHALSNVGYEMLRGMAISCGLDPQGSAPELRIAIANFRADQEMQKRGTNAVREEMEKEALLTK